jgi:hypothetical protein
MSLLDARSRARRGALCFAAATALLLSGVAPSDASDRPIAIGEIATPAAHDDPALAAAMRASVERELAGLDLSRVPRGKRWVLSASLVRLEAETAGGVARVSCVVSTVVREARGGAIRAIIEGKAKAENDPTHRAQAELGALDAAVHGAIVAVPSVL